MRIQLGDTDFPARLFTTKRRGAARERTLLVINESIALEPEDVAAVGCALVNATAPEREALGRAGFRGLLEPD